MTREEAIRVLEAEKKFLFYGSLSDKHYEPAFDMAIEALSEPINCVKCKHYYETEDDTDVHGHCKMDTAHKADAVGKWIPCGEKMPKELERVNVTWLNHNPPFYYQYIKDIPQTDTAVYYRGKWYWWDATVIDVLAEYGEDCNAEQIDKDIEVVAWMPLPTPYKGGDCDGEINE